MRLWRIGPKESRAFRFSSAVQQRNVVNNCRLASLDCEGTCLQADAARVAAVRYLRLRPQAALSLRAFDCHRTWRGSCASRTGARVRHAACLRLMAFSQWARSLPLPRFAELVLRRPWLDSVFPRLRGSGPGFLMESSLRGSLGSSGSGSSVADSVLKQLASLEQSLSSNLAGLRQIQATVAAMEGTGKPETQSQSLQSQRAAATPATAVCEGTQDQRSTLLETKWQLGRQVKWFEASALHSSMC